MVQNKPRTRSSAKVTGNAGPAHFLDRRASRAVRAHFVTNLHVTPGLPFDCDTVFISPCEAGLFISLGRELGRVVARRDPSPETEPQVPELEGHEAGIFRQYSQTKVDPAWSERIWEGAAKISRTVFEGSYFDYPNPDPVDSEGRVRPVVPGYIGQRGGRI